MDIQNPFGGPVIWNSTTGSTMEDAENWWKECRRHKQDSLALGAVLGADLQTRGQGRMPGRRWDAESGRALTFTLVLPARQDFPRSLILARGVVSCLENLGLECRIKWPNDILVHDRKICGILVTSSGISSGAPGKQEAVHFCGLGINLFQTGFDHETMRRPPTSLAMEGISVSKEGLFHDLLVRFQEAEQESSAMILRDVESRLWRRGEEITLHNPHQPGTDMSGIVHGLGKDGCLLLSTHEGIKQVYSGE